MKFVLLIITTLFCLGKGFATTGGPQKLTAIGYTEEEVFFVMEYFDESGRGPQLWIYNLSSGLVTTDNKWVFEDDYRNTEDIVKEIRSTYSINKMKKAFDEYSYNVNDIDIIPLESIQKFDKYNEMYYDVFPYTLKYGNYSVGIEICYGGKPEVHHHFTINDNHFAIIRYTGLCYESGYKKDTLFAFTDEIIEDTIEQNILIVPDSIEATDSLEIEQSKTEEESEEKQETYWKRGTPNYLFIIFPVVMILLAVIVLKWKKKN